MYEHSTAMIKDVLGLPELGKLLQQCNILHITSYFSVR